MTPNDGIKVLELLLNGGVVNVLMALLGLIVIGFLALVGVIAWLTITQAPKFNEHLGDITSCLKEGKTEFAKILDEHSEDFKVVKSGLGEVKEKVISIHALVSRS